MSFVASHIFPELKGLSLKEIKENHPDKRQIAKAAGFAINYGGNGYTIANNLGISQAEGDAVYNAYFKAFPGLNDYFEKRKKQLWKNGYIEYNNIDRFKLYIDTEWFENYKIKYLTPEFWDAYRQEKELDSDEFKKNLKPISSKYFRKKSSLERNALNYPIQGTSASITKVAGLLFFEELIKLDLLYTVKICNFVHDEIVVECPNALGDKIALLLKECMEKAGSYYCKLVPLKAEPVITPYWKH